jgi:hypothetical protein
VLVGRQLLRFQRLPAILGSVEQDGQQGLSGTLCEPGPAVDPKRSFPIRRRRHCVALHHERLVRQTCRPSLAVDVGVRESKRIWGDL